MHQLTAVLVLQRRLRHQLDRHLAVIELILGEIHDAGRAVAEFPQDFILADPVNG